MDNRASTEKEGREGVRPRYETKDDKTKELSILKELQEIYRGRVQVFRAGNGARYDGLLCSRNRDNDLTVRSIIEIKRRSHNYGTFPTYMISAEKLKSLWEFCRFVGGVDSWKWRFTVATPIKIILVVRFLDCLKWCDVSEKQKTKFTFEMGGRNDRGDKWDMEKVYFIPIELFKSFPEKTSNVTAA